MNIEHGDRREVPSNISAEVSKVVIGKDDIKEIFLLALLSEGHVLLEGLPGTAKTTLTNTFAQAIGVQFRRVQGTPDTLPADITGFNFYRPDISSEFIPGPIFANVLLIDELNRLTPRCQSALLQAMQENQVTIERVTHALEKPFMVIATQLPYGGVGTSPLSDVQIDRFMFRIWSGFPNREEEDRILHNIDDILEPHTSQVATRDDILYLRQEVKKVHLTDSIRAYIINILNNLRQQPDLKLGPSPRAGISLFKASRALAFIQGRDFVIPDDVKKLVIPAVFHRLRISAEAEMENVTPENIINNTLSEVPVPKVES